MYQTYENNILTMDSRVIGIDVSTGEKVYSEHGEVVEIKLPKLKGTEEQIAFADSIRMEKLQRTIERIEDMGIEGFKKAGKLNTAQEVYDKILSNKEHDSYMRESDAATIIENRYKTK